MNLDRRSLLIASPLIAAAALAGGEGMHRGSIGEPSHTDGPGPDPRETFVLPYDKMAFQAWGSLPPDSGQMATLYGDLNKSGPYLVMMRWNPARFSAPHS